MNSIVQYSIGIEKRVIIYLNIQKIYSGHFIWFGDLSQKGAYFKKDNSVFFMLELSLFAS